MIIQVRERELREGGRELERECVCGRDRERVCVGEIERKKETEIEMDEMREGEKQTDRECVLLRFLNLVVVVVRIPMR